MGKTSYSVSEKDFIDLKDAGILGENKLLFEEAVWLRPIKVEVEIVFPSEQDEAKIKKGVSVVVKKYSNLVAKQASDAFSVIVECIKEDRRGGTKAFGEAESALKKFNSFVKERMESFRLDLREAVADQCGLKAKELMTVGRVSTKESEIKAGAFRSETVVDKTEDSEANEELVAAVKRKDWMYAGVAIGGAQARVALNRKKAFQGTALKRLSELFPKDERTTLKFAPAMMYSNGAGQYIFEFLKGENHGKPDRKLESLLRRGMGSQLDRRVTVTALVNLPAYSKEQSKTTTETTTKTSTKGGKTKGKG
ncbi:MAG: hypothetical protein QM775_10865 [Pirellulales bacterium]